MSGDNRPLELSENVYLVGAAELHNNLQCNSYLIVDNGSAVLFDAGSVLDFQYVYRNIERIIDPHCITHFIQHHQDPDLCSALPLFEERGVTGEVVTHWRTRVIVQYYGIKSSYYHVDEHGYSLTLPSGRKLSFLMTPYLHFPGAMVTYDETSKTLFSSDLFGAFFINDELQTTFAGDRYMDAMLAFHEHYMPGNELLRPVMDVFLSMHIQRIAPQHGSIIDNGVEKYIRALRDLECGSFLHPIRKELAASGGYIAICNEVIRRCHAIAGVKETTSLFADTDIVLDSSSGYIVDFSTSGELLWHNLFRIIQKQQGVGWLSALEIMTQRLSQEYGVPMPDVYESVVADISRQAQQSDKMYHEADELSKRLTKNIEETREQLLHDPVSGLYNAPFFMQYLKNDLGGEGRKSGAFLLASLDNLQKINYKYGTVQGDATVKAGALLLQEHKTGTMVAARLEGAVYGVYMPDVTLDDAVQWADSLRLKITTSNVFIEPSTISAGVAATTEIHASLLSASEIVQFLHKTAGMRLRIAHKRGGDYVCRESSGSDDPDVTTGKVLVVDTERVNVDILVTVLRQMDFDVCSAGDGETAQSTINSFQPDIVICEAMLPKIDGFSLREGLLRSSRMKTKPFILMSHIKDEASVKRAHALDIIHYLKKPYLLSELVGIVKKIVRSSSAV